MKKLLASLALAATAFVANANVVLTFDAAPNGYATGAYTEGDFKFQIILGSGGAFDHFGDGTYVSGTLNWHDSGDNGDGSYVLMTRTDGAAFTLSGFDYSTNGFDLSCGGSFTGSGTANVASCNSVTEVRFQNVGYAHQLDNVSVDAAALPEPASLALTGLALGALALVRRRAAR